MFFTYMGVYSFFYENPFNENDWISFLVIYYY